MDLQEEFRPVRGYEGKYEVSNLGRVKSLNYNRTGVPAFIGSIDSKGYARVILASNGSILHQKVHQLVAKHFIEPSANPLAIDVNHIDGDKLNNRVSNLEWVTRGENSILAHKTGLINLFGAKHHKTHLTDSDVLRIRDLYHTTGQKELAKMFGICRTQVSLIVIGSAWPHLPVQNYAGRKRKIPRPTA